MSITMQALLWLFPIAFMFHDFEEILFWESWLHKNGDEVKRRVPAVMAKQVGVIVEKSTAPAALPRAILLVPFILLMHKVGEQVFQKVSRLLVG